MIKSLEINNFQSHERSRLEFNPGVNVIIGSSDNGKTACIRSLRWAIWNKPSGDAIRSWWGGDTWVRVETEKGYVIRSKDKMDKYILTTYQSNKKGVSHEEEHTFKAFGTGVPEEISRFFNFSEINLQLQLDSVFLLSKTSGEVAAHFNKIAKLDEIDTSTQNINGWIKRLGNDITYQKQQVKSLSDELTKYDYLEKVEIKLEVLESKTSESRDLKRKRDQLWDLMWEIKDVKSNIDAESEIIVHEKAVNNLLSLIKTRREYQEKRKQLYNLAEDIREIKEEVKQQALILIFEDTINKLIDLYQNKREKVYQLNKLFTLLSSIKDVKKKIRESEIKYNQLHKEFDRVFPDICPLCNK